jgi:hypothetical protein
LKAKNTAIRIGCLLLCSGVLYAEEMDTHLVQRGETFSQIARRYLGNPVYRTSGSLAKLKQLNPEINDENIIFPGQKINLGSFSDRSITAHSIELHSMIRIEPSRSHFSGTKSIPTASRRIASAANENTTVAVSEIPNSSAPAAKTQIENLEKKTATSEQILPTPELPKVAAIPAAPMQNKETSEEEEVGHKALFSASYGITTLSAMDASSGATANLFSSHDLTVAAAWEQDWTDTFSTSFGAKIRSIDFAPSTNSAKTLSGTKKTNTDFLFGAEQKISSKFSLHYGAGYGTKLFLHGMDSSTVTVDAVPVPSAHLGASLELVKKGKTSLGIKGQFEYLFPASTDSYPVNAGTDYQGILYVRRKYGQENSVELNLGYHDRSQNTSLVNFHEKGVSATLLFSIPLFEGDKK